VTTITKQWLQQTIDEMETARDDIPFGLDEHDAKVLAALKQLLAGLEQEPVAWTDADELRDVMNGGSGYLFAISGDANKFADPRRQMMLYAAPQPLTDAEPQFKAAVATLEHHGFTWNGGEQWKPPLGLPPAFISNDRAELEQYRKAAVTASDGQYPERQSLLLSKDESFASLRALASEVHRLASDLEVGDERTELFAVYNVLHNVTRHGYAMQVEEVMNPLMENAPEWTDAQCFEFLAVAFRHSKISGDIKFDDIRLGVKMANVYGGSGG
jgi:hypothetical protein